MKNEQKIDARLLSAASFVREGAIVADIGSDHAYLPIYLVQNKRAVRAVAADINAGPIENARLNVEAAGLSRLISLELCDGLHGIEKYSPTDIIICGMGGELIERIITEAPYAKNGGIRLILQPMSKQEILRAYLLREGYNIIDEKLSKDDGRTYVCICAEYDGAVREYSDAELLLGRHNIERREPLFYDLLESKIAATKKRINGMKTAGRKTPEDDALLAVLESLKEEKQ